MKRGRSSTDYEPVTRSRQKQLPVSEAAAADWPLRVNGSTSGEPPPAETEKSQPARSASRVIEGERWSLKRGHSLSYAGLFLYTTFVYFRPYELSPSLAPLVWVTFWLAVATLIVFIPSQLALEGTLTARPREVNLVLLLTLTALLSIPLAIDPAVAWATFNFVFIKAVLMFIVMVNVLRTERRLKGLILLALAVGCMISASAFNDYRLGNFTVEGYRVVGNIGGMFGNANDMALHLAIMVPIAIVLFLSTRNVLKKALYGACILLMVAGTFVTYSRGAFLGLACAGVVLAYKLGRRNRLLVIGLIIFAIAVTLVLAPGDYAVRLVSIFDHSLDRTGSAQQRQALLFRSIWIALNNPIFGVGMGNFHIVSIRGLVSHNSYTQVAAEIGFPALIIYTLFMIAPYKRLRRIEHETFTATRHGSRFYYLAVGLQASLVCYMVSSFFISVAYQWNIYYLAGYAICLSRLHETGRAAAGSGDAVDFNGRASENETLDSLHIDKMLSVKGDD